jgi:peptidoglycan hydrolase-like protein with peptidoglycan-binding domain
MMKRGFWKLFLPSLFLSGILAQPVAAQTIEALQAQLKAQQNSGAVTISPSVNNSVASGGTDVIYYFVPTRNLYLGLRDSETGGEVSELQKFLKSHGPVVYPEGIVSGFYGNLTERAVQRWQAVNGVVSSGTPATTGYGVVGPKTRVAIKDFVARTQAFNEAQSQNTAEPAVDLPNENNSAITSEDSFQVELGNNNLAARLNPKAPVISSITPRSGPPGTFVTIQGANFSKFGNTVMVGYTTLKNVSSPDGKTIRYLHNPPFYDTEDEFNGYADKEQFVQEALIPLGLSWEQFIEDSKEEHWIYVFNENGESAGTIFNGEPRVRFINPHVMTN